MSFKLNSKNLREGEDRSQSELEMMGRLGGRISTLLLNLHWTDSSTLSVFVAIVTLILW